MDKKIHKKISDSINTRMSEVLHDKINKMDKIGELKEKLAWAYAYTVNDPYELGDFKFAFEAGFDAAMELQLPVLEFQNKVADWLLKCFGEEISHDKIERNHRFLEESLELVQSIGCTKSEAHQLVEYVFNRPSGETFQEIGGVMVTLAALCYANKFDMNVEANKELERVYLKIDKIREKQANKPKHSPLPENIYQPEK